MNKSKPGLISKLDRATRRAAEIAISRGFPIPGSGNVTYVGNFLVLKNSDNLYDVMTLDKSVLYGNISAKDIAIIIAQRVNNKEFSVVNRIIELEKKFTKYQLDMIFYLHSYRGAVKSHDYEKMYILEDKVGNIDQRVKHIRKTILSFRKVK